MKRLLCVLLAVTLLLGVLPAAAADQSPSDYGWYTDNSNYSGWTVDETGTAYTICHDGSNSKRIWKPILEDTENFTLSLTVEILAIRAYVEILGTRLELNPSGGNGNQVYSPDYGNWFDARGQEVAVTLSRANGGDLQVRYVGKNNPVAVGFTKTPADGSNPNLVLGVIEAGGSAVFHWLSQTGSDPGDFGWYTDNSNYSGWTVDETGTAYTICHNGSNSKRIWKPILEDTENFALSLTVEILAIRGYVEILGTRLELNASGGNGNQVYSPDYGNWFDAQGQKVSVKLRRENGGDLQVSYEGASTVSFTKTPADGSNPNLVLGVIEAGGSVAFRDLSCRFGSQMDQLAVKIGHSVSFDSDLKMNYRIKYENLAAALPNYVAEGAYLVVEKDRYPVQGAPYVETVILRPDLSTDSSRMIFTLEGLQSVEMGSQLRAVLHIFDKAGWEYTTTVDTSSILDYVQMCFDSYSPTANPELFTMLMDLLNYGAAAQSYFGRRSDTLVTAGMEAYQIYATTTLAAELTDVKTTLESGNTITAVSKMGFSVTFADRTELNVRLSLADGYGKEQISCVKVLDEKGSVVDTLTELTLLEDGRLQATYTGIKSTQLRDMYYFVAYVGELPASQKVGYSVEAYAKSNLNAAEGADLVLKCMYYGDSAAAYFRTQQSNYYLRTAQTVQQDLYANFWDAENNHLCTTYHGYVGADKQDMIWDHGIAIFEMYTLWHALPEDSADRAALTEMFRGEWAHLKRSFTYEQMTSGFGAAPNIAIDDTGWDAMVYLIMYHVLGEEECLTLARDCVRNAYDYFKDGEVGNGLWYTAQRDENSDNRFKSMSYVGLMYAALEYTLASGDDSLMADTLALYQWTEDNMLRNGTKTYQNSLFDGSSITVTVSDNLYWMDYNVNRSGRTVVNGPDGAKQPNQVAEASSVSALFVNMAMGCIQADLYAITGQTQYLEHAIRTVRALNDSEYYNNKGAYVNDRDAWANAMFVGPWVRQVLTLPGVTQADYDRIFTTADHILLYARTEEGYYKGGWSGSDTWDPHADPKQIMTTGTTLNMITAAALLEQLLQ